jgi:protein O-mannosyl-transferase
MNAPGKKQQMPKVAKPSQPVVRWRVPAVCLMLAAITFAVFGQTVGFGFIDFDDNLYVYENARVTGGLSLKGIIWVFTHSDCNLYHPLTMLSLMTDYQLYGLHAGGYHFTNVLLHTASVILLFLILQQMTGALWRSAFVAAVFAIHPLRAESVAWVAERKDVLSGFFFMLTLAAYVHYVRNPKSPARYLMVAAAFVLALLSKPTVVTLPFVLLLLDYWPLRRVESAGKLALEKLPLLALAAGGCATTVLAVGKEISTHADISMLSRVGNAVVSYAIYLRQMLWPEGLTPFYPLPEKGYALWTVAFAFLLLALIGGGVLAFGRKRRWLLTGWLWYLGMLTPMIGLVQVGAFAHADRYTYLPQIGIYLAVTWWVAEWQFSRMALGALMAGVLGIFMVCAWQQTGIWQNSETLWTYTLACAPDNDIAEDKLGLVLMKKGRLDIAITYFQHAAQIRPGSAEAHNTLGNALLQMGKVDDAIAQCRQAVGLRPDDADAWGNLGNALFRKGKADDAIAAFQKALQLNPASAMAHNNLGAVFLQKGNLDDAIGEYQKALQIKPLLAEAHYNLANALVRKGSAEEAIRHFEQAVQIDPADPRFQNDLAWLLATSRQALLRNGNEALELARRANKLAGGNNPVFLGTLAAAFAEAGQFEDARRIVKEAISLAQAAGRKELVQRLNGELQLYEAGRPFHQP